MSGNEQPQSLPTRRWIYRCDAKEDQEGPHLHPIREEVYACLTPDNRRLVELKMKAVPGVGIFESASFGAMPDLPGLYRILIIFDEM